MDFLFDGGRESNSLSLIVSDYQCRFTLWVRLHKGKHWNFTKPLFFSIMLVCFSRLPSETRMIFFKVSLLFFMPRLMQYGLCFEFQFRLLFYCLINKELKFRKLCKVRQNLIYFLLCLSSFSAKQLLLQGLLFISLFNLFSD